MKLLVLTTIVLASRADDCDNAEFDQCGGNPFSGSTCCPSYDNCTIINEYYSQCLPLDLCLTAEYGQCDGQIDGEPLDDKFKCCPDSFECTYQSEYYSQCTPVDSNTTDCAGAYEQCNGTDANNDPWGSLPSEKLCCIAGYECVATNEYYSGCNPIPICSNARYAQCGGTDENGDPWTDKHDSCCPDGYECSYLSQYYSQCVPADDSTTTTNNNKAADGACASDSDCDDGLSCVVESAYYSQCIDCSATSFSEQCNYWSETFLAAAEDKCGIDVCGTRCPHHDDTDCSDGETCVVQSDGYWSQCVDCSESSFDEQCKYWSDQIRAAAEEDCGLTCPMTQNSKENAVDFATA